ncbi:MAG: response regulator [Alphaproteobacteria bacterium]|nr:response regulator [Alphaproteobacteria bacterium]
MPRPAKIAASMEISPSTHNNDTSPRKVLIVEDDSTHMSFIEKILARTGVQTVQAENGLAALARLNAEPHFDLILMDWDMPVMDGLQTVKAIREQEREENIPHKPVIVFTARTRPGDKEKCLAAGMDAYLPKDVWMGRWRQSLLDNLQGLFVGNIDVQDFQDHTRDATQAQTEFDPQFDVFDDTALHEAKVILRDDFMIAIQEYLEDAAAYIKEIREGLQQKDWKKIERGAHPLKSNSKCFGLLGLATAAQTLNDLAREQHHDDESFSDAQRLLNCLQQAFTHGEKRLQASIKKQQASA